ncbi:hypothetical protein BpHYR1_023193 [Brachionus plicatilis]|uniref:MULE transposase domain-containing protein n=1 Tax=Brachionus plicatilis TaxID=10195 RepID=A0A3M7PTT8_BRAPC|nr:hypothetical protein BpHYR1_023193 [Brachionus plicatilis]
MPTYNGLTITVNRKRKTIMTDFEKGAMNTGRSVFKQTNIKACLFHLTDKNMEAFKVTWSMWPIINL